MMKTMTKLTVFVFFTVRVFVFHTVFRARQQTWPCLPVPIAADVGQVGQTCRFPKSIDWASSSSTTVVCSEELASGSGKKRRKRRGATVTVIVLI